MGANAVETSTYNQLGKKIMRSDMKKVVVERPRRGSRQRNNKFGARLRYIPEHDYEDQPKKARGFESYGNGGSRKWFTDVLGPLERFLCGNAGRPWNKVYSEICAGLDKRKTTGLHIFQHLKDMVITNCYFGANGKICYLRWNHEEHEVDDLYVHPLSGLLCAPRPVNKRERKRAALLAEEVTLLRTGGDAGYQKHEGIWYCVKLRRVWVRWSYPQRTLAVHDIFLKREIELGGGEHWIAVEKRQCGRDELKDVQRLLAEREQKIRRM